jgi:hypothetical protein
MTPLSLPYECGHWIETPIPGRPGVIEREWVRSGATAPARRGKRNDGLPDWYIGRPPRATADLRLGAPPQVTLTFSERVWNELATLAREARDGRETAGGLWGDHIRLHQKRIALLRVTRAVKERRERSASLDIGDLVAEKASIRACGAADRFGEIGCWHTEPGSFRRPSDTDLQTWSSALELARPGRCSSYLGLILTDAAGDGRWSRVEAHAFVLRRVLGRAVCEPAALDHRSSNTATTRATRDSPLGFVLLRRTPV